MRTVYFDFYIDDFVLYMPPDSQIVEIGVRHSRVNVASAPTKCTPYLMCIFPGGRLGAPTPNRFRAVPVNPHDRIRGEAHIQGGCPAVGRQYVSRAVRPIQQNSPFSNLASMRLVGKFTLPEPGALGYGETPKHNSEAATHMLFLEATLGSEGTTTVSTGPVVTSNINENNIARAF